jgi:hypothetical protein
MPWFYNTYAYNNTVSMVYLVFSSIHFCFESNILLGVLFLVPHVHLDVIKKGNETNEKKGDDTYLF